MPIAPILLIEDDRDDVKFLRRALAKHSIVNPVVVTGSVAEAQRHLRAAAASGSLPVVVLVDLYLPGASGLDLLQWLRAQPGIVSSVPAIVLSISGDPSLETKALALGAVMFLRKPVTEEMLPDVLTGLGLVLSSKASGPAEQIIERRAPTS